MHLLPIRRTPPLCAGNPENGALVLGMEGVFLSQKDNTRGHYIWGLKGYQALGIASYPSLWIRLLMSCAGAVDALGACRCGMRRAGHAGLGMQADLRLQRACIKAWRLENSAWALNAFGKIPTGPAQQQHEPAPVKARPGVELATGRDVLMPHHVLQGVEQGQLLQ